MSTTPCLAEQLDRDGFAVAPRVYSASEVTGWREELSQLLGSTASDGPLRNGSGSVYGARNLLELWTPATTVWRHGAMLDVLRDAFGAEAEFGLVRVLFFDKPPGSSWALPWHKDLTIAVRDNSLPSRHFTKPTRKANIPHVEAPLEVLEAMLTARVHLDEVTDENGPLKVVAGSHRTGKSMQLDAGTVRTVLAQPGDVLLMRPLLAHSSGNALEGTSRHRRILHLEFAARRELPDGYEWHDFVPARCD